MLRRLFGRTEAPGAWLPQGMRVYAVGDIHGRLDLLEALLARIEADDAARGAVQSEIVFLGDLIDRGPDSAGVVERLRLLSAQRERVHFLRGNHEELFLLALAGNQEATRLFARVGGRETALSYGVTPAEYDACDFSELGPLLASRVPDSHLAFIDGFRDMLEFGDYLFVHAGIRPGVPIAEQAASDLRWIRREFLEHRGSFGRIVVHGHSITPGVDRRPNRIGIDTGAYATDRLTAIGLEQDQQWFLSTGGGDPT